jgi:hypothetical protein
VSGHIIRAALLPTNDANCYQINNAIAFKHGTPVIDISESASKRREVDGIDARA